MQESRCQNAARLGDPHHLSCNWMNVFGRPLFVSISDPTTFARSSLRQQIAGMILCLLKKEEHLFLVSLIGIVNPVSNGARPRSTSRAVVKSAKRLEQSKSASGRGMLGAPIGKLHDRDRYRGFEALQRTVTPLLDHWLTAVKPRDPSKRWRDGRGFTSTSRFTWLGYPIFVKIKHERGLASPATSTRKSLQARNGHS